MSAIIQLKRGTAAALTSANPVLAAGEVVFETDTKKMKVGDGSTAWTSLTYTVTDGDISAVTAGTGLSGGGNSGAVTLAVDTATVATLTGTQTLTNKTIDAASNTLTGVTTLTGTQTLTNKTISATSNTITGVINNTLTTTTGDLIYASGANTPARLGIGSASQVLQVSSGGIPEWAAPAGGGGGGMTLLQTYNVAGLTNPTFTSINQTYKNLQFVVSNFHPTSTETLRVYFNGLSSGNSYVRQITMINDELSFSLTGQQTSYFTTGFDLYPGGPTGGFVLNVINYSDTSGEKPITMYGGGTGMPVTNWSASHASGAFGSHTAVASVTFAMAFSIGTIKMYGVK